jgi:hypothetical protein
MAKRLARGRFANRGVRAVLAGLEALDSVVLRWFPSLRAYCGEVVIVARK